MQRGRRLTAAALVILAGALLRPSAATEISAGYGPPAAANTWQQFSIPLTPAAFGTDAATFSQILSNVTRFRIRTEMHDGTDVGAVDDVSVGSAHRATFDADSEGWSASGDGVMAWVATGGHAGAYIQISDWASGDWHYAVAPDTWLGDWSALSGAAITFWFKTNYPDYAAVVEISGGSGAVKQLSLTSSVYAVPPSGRIVLTLAMSETSATPTVVTLSTSNSFSFAVPATVTIPAGQTRTTFEAVAGTTVGASATITAWATGFASSRVTLQIVAAAPTVSSVTPSSGPTTGGTRVTLGGANFRDGASVQFGGAYATDVRFVNATTLECRTPASPAAGKVAVTVLLPGGLSGSKADAFTYREPVTVTSVTPDAGQAGGGDRVTIRGTGFADSGIIVVFGDDPDCRGTDIRVASSTELTCLTPPHQAGVVDVAVFNSPSLDGGLRRNAYTYSEARVSAWFRERFSQDELQETTKPTFTREDGRFNLVGVMDLTGFDTAALNRDSQFCFGPANGRPDDDQWPTVAVRLGDDPHYFVGDRDFFYYYVHVAEPGPRGLKVKLNWESPSRLRFSITGTYWSSDPGDGTPSGGGGYWLVARDFLTETSAAGGFWDGEISFGGPTRPWVGRVLVPYVTGTGVRTHTLRTGEVLTRRDVGAVGW